MPNPHYVFVSAKPFQAKLSGVKMSFRKKTDVYTHLAGSRNHPSSPMLTPASEADSIGGCFADENATFEKDDLTESLAILVEKSKSLPTFGRTVERM